MDFSLPKMSNFDFTSFIWHVYFEKFPFKTLKIGQNQTYDSLDLDFVTKIDTLI